MLTDSKGDVCPFCIENGFVKIIDKLTGAYLVQVVKNIDGSMIPQIGRYFIILTQHKESILERPDDWTRAENILLRSALEDAGQDEELMRLMDGRDLFDSINTSWNNGWWAGQRVRHIHMWVLFRYDDLASGLDGTIDQVHDLKKSEIALRSRVTDLEFAAMEDQAEIAALRRHSGLQLND